MSSPLLDVKIKKYTFTKTKLLIHYSLSSLTSKSLFMIRDTHIPFLRIGSIKTQLEIWLGISPQTEIEKSKDINILILPDTFELPPQTSINEITTINFPFKKSGYWLEENEETEIQFAQKKIKAQIIQGFGTEKIDHRKVRNIYELYTWQSTIRSQIIELELPKQEA